MSTRASLSPRRAFACFLLLKSGVNSQTCCRGLGFVASGIFTFDFLQLGLYIAQVVLALERIARQGTPRDGGLSLWCGRGCD